MGRRCCGKHQAKHGKAISVMDFREFLKSNRVILDGGMGTLLQRKGLAPGEKGERWNLTHPEVITQIHTDYFNAGANVVCTNTFGASCINFAPDELDAIIEGALGCAKAAREKSSSPQRKFIALDIGPTGKLLAPLGDLDFEDAVEIFAKTVRAGAKYGADLVIVETMNDSYETKAALLAVKESCSLPVIVTNAYGEDSKLMTGASPSAMVALLEGMGVDALGANCSLGPSQLSGVVDELLEKASVPVVLKPNAGLPEVIGNETVYNVSPRKFAEEVALSAKKGVRIAGGCCGTTPEYIKEMSDALDKIPLSEITPKGITCVSSFTHAVELGEEPVLIGERINPTGKKRFKQALLEGDMDYILSEGVAQQEKGVHILDLNVGLPDIDEVALLTDSLCALQTVTDLPLQIDTSDPVAMERALRRYNGKAMVNSVNGKRESMSAVLPLVKKYGGLVVALTLDESGIPATARGRVEIAKKILDEAAKYGIDRKDIIFDPLAMTVSADNSSAKVTLEALSLIKNELGCHTCLGVSNVSFGLPCRDAVNSTFFALALSKGLSASIMNPHSAEMMKTYYTYRALACLDENCADYIAFADTLTPAQTVTSQVKRENDEKELTLSDAIVKGFKDKAALLCASLLTRATSEEVINAHIIPALDRVGADFEAKRIYLPQLLTSAEAAKAAFEVIKEKESKSKTASSKKGVFVIATVKGDIHDIGKNIVKLLLENYGFKVVDLGKDVDPELIAQTAAELDAPLVGLSALMTTTVPAMEETIRLLRKKAPRCKIVVGGAVLNADYARKIGADKYARDAMDTVRYAESVVKG